MTNLKTKLAENLNSWIDVDERTGVKLNSDGSLTISCRDTEEDPDDGHAHTVLADHGIIVEFTGNGDGEEEHYVESFEAGNWSMGKSKIEELA